jgi:hypothetical protein
LILFAPDETTRAVIDMYARTTVGLIRGPIDAAGIDRLRIGVRAAPQSLVVVQLPAHPRAIAFGAAHRLPPDAEPQIAWAAAAHLRLARTYSLPNGRRYALLASEPQSTAASSEP